jgi:PhnB protein
MPDRALMEQLDQAIDAMFSGSRPLRSDNPTVSALMGIAGRLRDLPHEGFKTRLNQDLLTEFRRRPPMSVSTHAEFAAIRSIIPFICVSEGPKLIDFIKHTFGAIETSRQPHGSHGFVASLRIGDSDLLIMGDPSLREQELPAALHVYVKDCDATYRRALEGGAVTIGSPGVGEPADRPYGERAAFVSDRFGNTWFIATRLGSSYVGVGLSHVTPCLLPSNARPVIDFLKRAFGAKVEGLHEEAGRMVHAFVRIGEAMVEMAEAGEEGDRPFGFYMHTDDVDALYHRALSAGAASILPPADQLYGDRLAILEDPAGNRWFAAKRITA